MCEMFSMLDVAVRQLGRSPGRTAGRALAVGGAIALILLFEGFRIGIERQMAAVPAGLPADLVAIEAGKAHLTGGGSRIPQEARASIERIAGVAVAHPLLTVPVIFDHGSRRTPMQLVAYDTAGGPTRLSAGHPIDGPRQIVLDERLAQTHRVRAGERVRLLDREFTVAGLSTGTDVMFDPYAFVTYDELIDTYLDSKIPGAVGGAPLLGYLLIRLKPDASREATRARIVREVPAVDLYTPAELASSDVRFGRRLFGSVLDLMTGIAWVAVVLAVGFTAYGSVLDRRRELGVMKALGVRPSGVATLVLEEAALVTLLALPIALLLARLGAAAIEWRSPLYRLIPWDGTVLWRALAAAIAAALVGALLPARNVVRLEPDLVFRS